MEIDKNLIKELRAITGFGILDCKNALESTGSDLERSVENLRKKGAKVVQNRSHKKAAEGIVHAYIDPLKGIGVLVEINCETDFVASTEDVKNFAVSLARHVSSLEEMHGVFSKINPEDIGYKEELDALIIKTRENILINKIACFRST